MFVIKLLKYKCKIRSKQRVDVEINHYQKAWITCEIYMYIYFDIEMNIYLLHITYIYVTLNVENCLMYTLDN
jgi:hypothetical protein